MGQFAKSIVPLVDALWDDTPLTDQPDPTAEPPSYVDRRIKQAYNPMIIISYSYRYKQS